MAPDKDEKEKVTKMILYVDLKCPCCYKKVRKLLCKYPQIRGQVFDEDKNKVTITVVCWDPERFRDMLCCKGGRAIQSIEIVENKPPPPKQPKPDVPPPHKPPPPADPMPQPVVVQQPQPQQPDPMPMNGCHPRRPFCPPVSTCCQECYEGRDGGPCHYGFGRPVPPPAEKPKPDPTPMNGCHPRRPFCPPVSTCCQECYEGRDGGPCHYGFGRPVPPPPCYDYYGYQYPPNRPCYVSRCDYFSEDNPQGCSIM